MRGEQELKIPPIRVGEIIWYWHYLRFRDVGMICGPAVLPQWQGLYRDSRR